MHDSVEGSYNQVVHFNMQSYNQQIYCKTVTFVSFRKYIKLIFVVVSHKIFLARLFCAPLPAASGGNCPSLPPVCYATAMKVIHLFQAFFNAIFSCISCAASDYNTTQRVARSLCAIAELLICMYSVFRSVYSLSCAHDLTSSVAVFDVSNILFLE